MKLRGGERKSEQPSSRGNYFKRVLLPALAESDYGLERTGAVKPIEDQKTTNQPSPLEKSSKRTRNYFKTCGLIFSNTLVNNLYGLEVTNLKHSAEEAKHQHPKLSKTVELTTKYSFWVGLALLGKVISDHTRPEIGYTAAYTHPFLVSLTGRYLKHKIQKGSEEHKDDFNLLSSLKPDLKTYSATFSLTELASVPLFILVMNGVVSLSSGAVGMALGVASTILAAASTIVVEYLAFRYLWKKYVFHNVPKGNIADEFRGFISEFKPLRLFRQSQKPNPAHNDSEYLGQIWGVIETHYFWVQLGRAIVAAILVNVYNILPQDFVGLFFEKSAQWGKLFLDGAVSAKHYIAIEKKLKENNESLGVQVE